MDIKSRILRRQRWGLVGELWLSQKAASVKYWIIARFSSAKGSDVVVINHVYMRKPSNTFLQSESTSIS